MISNKTMPSHEGGKEDKRIEALTEQLQQD